MKKILLIILLSFAGHEMAMAQLETQEAYPTGYVTGFYSIRSPFQDIDGVLYSVYKYGGGNHTYDDCWTLVKYPSNKTASTYIVDSRCQRIAKGAFEGARFLKTIIIPSSVSYIGDNAFEGCTSLENIYYGDTTNNVQASPSDNNDSKEPIEVARYNLQGIRCSPSEKGVQIVVYSDYTTKTIIVE